MRILLFVFIAIFLMGCSARDSRVSSELDESERLLIEDPVAALKSLNKYDVTEFSDSSVMARWALLYAEALAANNLSAPNDTIVNIAIDYYGHHTKSTEYERASHLKSLIKECSCVDDLSEALYYQKEKEFYLYNERLKQQNTIYAGAFLISLGAGVIGLMRRRMKQQDSRNAILIAEASELKSRIDAGKTDIDRLEIKLHGLLDNRFSLIDSLCQTYYESQGTKNEKKAIVEKVKSEISSLQSDSLTGLEQAVNDCRDNLLLKAKEVYPDIKPEEYRLLVYLSSGFSTRTLCLLMNESADVIYKRKSRLKARIFPRAIEKYPKIMDIF